MNESLEQKTISRHDPGTLPENMGSSLLERELKKKIRAARRIRQERRQNERDETESLKELAEYDSLLSKDYIQECKNILRNNLSSEKFDWISYYKDEPYPPFVFKEPLPRYEQIAREMGIHQRNAIKEFFLPSLKKRRLQMETEARRLLELKLEEYNKRKDSAEAAYEMKRREFIEEQAEYNQSIDRLRLDLERGQPGAVESFARIILSLLKYPDAFEVEFDARYEQKDRLLVLEAVFPAPLEIPRTVRYQYVQEEHGITAVEMNDEEFAEFYQEILLQIGLSAVYIIFEMCRDKLVSQVGFNGRVRTAGFANESEELQPCIMTCRVDRERYRSVELSSVSSHDAFLRFNGIMSSPLSELWPVEPVQKMRQTPSPYPELEAVPDIKATPSGPEPYRPGDIENMAKELVSDIIEQIENNWEKTKKPGEIIH